MKNTYRTLPFCLVLICSVTAFSQQSERDRGIELYRAGKTKEAVKALQAAAKQDETKADALVWNYLGLAYLQNGNEKEGSKALEKAVKLAPQISAYRSNLAYACLFANKIDRAISESEKAVALDPQNAGAYLMRGTAYFRKEKLDEAIADADRAAALVPNFMLAYVLKADSLLFGFGREIERGAKPSEKIGLLEQAKEALERCGGSCQKDAAVSGRLEAVRAFYDHYKNRDGLFLRTEMPDSDVLPPKILSKPAVSYTGAARQAGVTGKIRLAVLFAASGEVTYTLVIKPLGYGLDEQAVRAARGIKFEPAEKNGKPISVVRIVEYSFSIY